MNNIKLNHSIRIGLMVILLAGAFPGYLQSQETNLPRPRATSWWVDLGAGPALVGNTFAMNAGMVYCYQFDRSIICARILGVTNNNPTVQRIDQATTMYKMADYGILYGPIWQTENGYISFGAGIGLVRAAYETTSDITTNTSLSLPVEAQWFWRFTSFAGFGLYTYATLNFEKPLYGVMICAQLGAW